MTTGIQRTRSSGNAGLWLVFIYLLTQVVDAPLRFFLVEAGVPFLIYARDLLLVAIIVPALIRATVTYRLSISFGVVTAGLIAFTLVGFYSVGNVYQVLFGVKIFLPLLAAVLVGPSVFRNPGLVRRMMTFLALLVASGVMLNVLVDYPWTGLQYQLEGYDIEGSFERSTFELSRYTGFSRTNFEAASQAILFSVPLLCLYEGRLAKLGLWLLTGAVIAITTTKGIVVAYAAISVLLLLVMATGLRWLAKAALVLSLVVMTALPFTLTELDVDLDDPTSVALFASLADRVNNGWPAILSELKNTGRWLFGKGIGGTGAAEFYFAAPGAASPDNMFIFLFATFGISAFLIVFWIAKRGWAVTYDKPWPDRFVVLTLLIVAIYGITGAVIESAVFSVFLGIALSYRGERTAQRGFLQETPEKRAA